MKKAGNRGVCYVSGFFLCAACRCAPVRTNARSLPPLCFIEHAAGTISVPRSAADTTNGNIAGSRDNFKKDHATILDNVTELRKLVHSGVVEHADSIGRMITSISSAIKLHLAAEDRMLYPALANSTSPDTARIGKAFQVEMGSIAAAYNEFSRTWNFGPSIAASPDAFRNDANRIFKALHERIQRENQELYPAAERI